MSGRPIQTGPTSARVAANIKVWREQRRLTQQALSGRLTDLGRPMLPSGIAKIELGMRRVDVDDLVIIALALEVEPNRLLFSDPEQNGLDAALSDWRAWLAGDER